jgi:hypothetical protein
VFLHDGSAAPAQLPAALQALRAARTARPAWQFDGAPETAAPADLNTGAT